MTALHLLGGGAARGVVAALRSTFFDTTGVDIEGAFGAVGAMKERLLAGEPCDVVILTAALIDQLTAAGRLVPGSGRALGRVRTGIAVRDGDALPDVSDAAALSAALTAADGIYFPDPERATAGIHFVQVLARLGIVAAVQPKLRPFPNGAVAMAQLAEAREVAAIGCTQITEIRYTEGVTLVGPLPQAFELATVYSAAVCIDARDRPHAMRFVELLGGPASERLRVDGGFEV